MCLKVLVCIFITDNILVVMFPGVRYIHNANLFKTYVNSNATR